MEHSHPGFLCGKRHTGFMAVIADVSTDTTATELTDAALLMFDKLMGGLSRRAERKAVDNAAAALRDAQRHLRLLARAGRALIAAREDGTDASEAVESAVGWGPFLRAVAEAEQIARPEAVDVRAELVQRWPAMRQFAPALLEAFAFEGTASASGLLKAVSLLRDTNQAGKRTLPGNASLGFIRRGWRPFVVDAGGKVNRRAWEVCVLSELRDRLRVGDVWVRGSRRYRNFEDCLLPKPTFAALRAEGPLPVGVEENVERRLATRCDALAAAMEDVAVLAKAGQLPDAVLDETGLRITPLRAETPPEALRVAQDAYGMLPRPWITDLLLEVDGWTKFSDCFTHQRSGRPVEERAALLTTVLADGINLGLSRMAESCQGHSLRQLAWMHDWHVREECYAAALRAPAQFEHPRGQGVGEADHCDVVVERPDRTRSSHLSFMYPDFSTMTAPTLIVVGDHDMGRLSTRGAGWWRDAYDLSPAC